MADLTPAQLAAEFAGSAARTERAASVALWGVASWVAEQQKRTVPVRSGYIRDTIEASGEDDRPFRPGVDLVAEVGPATPLAPLVEFGTRHAGPQPFVFNAADKALDRLQKVVLEAVDL